MRLASLMLALFLLAPLTGLAQTLKVPIDQAARVRLSKPIHDIMLGNPSVADVTVMDSRHLMIIGKSYGVTNLMVTDETGRTIFNRQVAVAAPDANRVSLFLGAGLIMDFTCTPRCQSTGAPTALSGVATASTTSSSQ